jgi:acyl-CoA hydrolase
VATSLRLSHPTEVLDHLRPGMTVFVPGMSGESLPFFEALRRDPDRANGLTFVGVHFPGINLTNYLELHPRVRQRAYFMSSSMRGELVSGRVDLLPLDYPGIVRDLEQNLPIDVAIAQVSTPDANGLCSLGACQDFLPSVWNTARLRIAHVNPRLPRTAGSFGIKTSDCQLAFEQDAQIPTLASDPPEATPLAHASLVAELIADGDTLQFGVGRLQAAILASLANHRRLRIYSGMVSTPVTRLLERGVIDGEGAIQCGAALGDAQFYASLHGNPMFYFRPARETHDVRRIAAIPNFCAINSAVEVDLFGQVNVDCLKGRLLAGVGGLPAFSAGARLSLGGRSIIVLPATGDAGRSSRIVVAAEPYGVIALPRHEADYVVTEYGVASLRGRSLHDRARDLIAIAAPQFRDALAARWDEVARRL